MKRLTQIALAALLVSVQLVSIACHRFGPPPKQFVVYVSEKDKNQIVGFEMAPQPLRQWWHGEPREPKADGQFIRNDGKEGTSGAYWSEANVYVVKGSQNEARFSIQPDLTLRDESGVTWRRSNDIHIAEKFDLHAWR
jgi:hypothetical protein